MLKFTMKILICIFCIMDLMANIYLLGLMFIYKILKAHFGQWLANCLCLLC
jgi:hypothetical protein